MQRPLMRPNADQTSLSLKITEAGTVKSDVDKAADERERVDGGPDRWAARATARARRARGRPDRRLCRQEFRRLTGFEITSSDCGRGGGDGERHTRKIREDEIPAFVVVW